jgi:membrane protein implicated in regulation of membrane protease activity
MIIGVLLLSAELLAIDAQFYLVFLGAAAILVGFAGIAGPDLPPWLEWLSFAALSVLMMFTLRRQLYEKMRGRPLGTVESDVGSHLAIVQDLPPGKSCRTEYRGSLWTAVNVGVQPIPAGSEARIESVDGLTLRVRGIGGEE